MIMCDISTVGKSYVVHSSNL